MPLPPGVEVKHFPNCRADYPEKPKGEAPQAIHEGAPFEGETDFCCVDCGGLVLVNAKGEVTHRYPE